MQCIGSFVEASKFCDLHERSDVIELIIHFFYSIRGALFSPVILGLSFVKRNNQADICIGNNFESLRLLLTRHQ